MAEPYGWDTIEACEELYILDGLSFEQVAEKSGVAVATLKRWSGDSQPTWPERRREYRQAQVSVRLEEDGRIATGQAADTDTLTASAKAYVNALNNLFARKEKSAPDAIASGF